MTLSLDEKVAGVLVPVFAIRGAGDLGIGDTWGLIEFVDWAAARGFRIVKILPINETGGDHSPYNAISSVALEPTTLRTSPEAIPDLSESDFARITGEFPTSKSHPAAVDYAVVKPLKKRLLEAAFTTFQRRHLQRRTKRGREFQAFVEEEAAWLESYSLFRTLMDVNGHELWPQWPEDHRTLEGAQTALAKLAAKAARAHRARVSYFNYVQWIAFDQWRRVKAHAASRGVALMGDIPFGVNFYSADVWARRDIFQTEWSGGTPPDLIFKHDEFVQKWGQNWGIPLYDWEQMRGNDFRWWRQRVRGVREIFDLFRIDHVLGFYRIYAFPFRPERNGEFLRLSAEEAAQRTGGLQPHFHPAADDTLAHCDRNRRDGEEYLRMILEEAGAGRVIGEDLGVVPAYVRPNLHALGIAGYKIPQWEKRDDGSLISGDEYERLSLATYGTHDHDPLRTMWEHLSNSKEGSEGAREWRALCDFAGIEKPTSEFTPAMHEALLRALFASNSWIAVLMITDVFARGERFNLPGISSGENWTQRMHANISDLDADAAERVSALLRATGRA